VDQSVSTVEEVADHFFKGTSSAKETTGGSRPLRLGRALGAAGVIALLVVAGLLWRLLPDHRPLSGID
jgi:hypothetical protein